MHNNYGQRLNHLNKMTTKKKLVKATKRGVTYKCDSGSIARKELGTNGEVRDTFIVFLNVGEVKMDGLVKEPFY